MAVRESAHRVEFAMANSGFQRSQSRVAINLAPARSRLLQRQIRSFRLNTFLDALIMSGCEPSDAANNEQDRGQENALKLQAVAEAS
jgi:hypothetical protein